MLCLKTGGLLSIASFSHRIDAMVIAISSYDFAVDRDRACVAAFALISTGTALKGLGVLRNALAALSC